MKRINGLLIVLLLLPFVMQAQFTRFGKIEYERKLNIHALMDEDEDSEWYQKIKSQVPKFTSTFYDLFFNTRETLYKPGRETDGQNKLFGMSSASENIVLTNFDTRRVKACKPIYEQKFIIEDTVRKMQWKIKDEIRTIANYKCRKAVSKICDSVYVVAFYTEDIMVSGGPEMMAGLPGMILELAIPRLHTTWTATKVDIIEPKESDFTVPDKGKHVDQKDLYESLKGSFKNWGKSANKNVWWCML